MVTFKLQTTLKEFIAAHYLHLRPRRAFGIPGSILLVLFLAVLLKEWCRPGGFDAADGFATFFAVWMLLYFVAFLPYRARKTFMQNKFRLHESEGQIDESGLHFRSDLGESHLPWDHFIKWKESKRLLILYPVDTQFLILAKRCLGSAEAVAEALSIIGKGIKKKF